MSFKRDGDDAAMLRNLQNRRVGDLLANNIPDDEAYLLCNGRITCTVCSYRPIFDTLAMLAVHRKGKKHIYELSKYLAQKREHERKKIKKDQLLSLRTGVKNAREDASLMPTLGKQLSVSTTNNSCTNSSNKRKFQGFDRKSAIEMNGIVNKKLDLDKPDGLVSTSSEVRKYIKSLWKKKRMQKTLEQRKSSYGTETDKASTSGAQVVAETAARQPVAIHTVTPEDISRAQHELQLRMSGWIKDMDGHWIKDPEAEFDSDEEQPNPPD